MSPLPTVNNDSGKVSSAISALKGAVSVKESEIKRWKRSFETNAKVEKDGEKCAVLFGSCLNVLLTVFFSLSPQVLRS
jgi:hypothetical protein